MIARVLIAVFVVCSCFPQIARAGGPANRSSAHLPFGVRTRAAGLVVTLFVERPSYPQDALVQATVRLWNSTPAPMRVQVPAVSVLWPSGKPSFAAQEGSYPAGVVTPPPPGRSTGSPSPRTVVIGPRQAIAQHVFVIMRTGRLQAATALNGTALRTPILLVRLGRAVSPVVSIKKEGTSVVAIIKPTSASKTGNPWYMSSMVCGAFTDVTRTWMSVPYTDRQPDGSYRFPAPSFESPSHWSLVVGWLGRPLGAANYSA